MDPRARRLLRDEDPSVRAMIVVAHPDDETIGAGALLQRLHAATIVHVTDGAPRDRALWNAPAEDRAAYAAARRAELAEAVALAGAHELRSLGGVDQEAVDRVPELARALAAMLAELHPEVVLTHPYEGGHPDHDATAVIVQAALALREQAGAIKPALVELALYHAQGGAPSFGRFLPDLARPEHAVTLAPEVRAKKHRMLACFTTQREVLAAFPVDVERYREGTVHDFGKPPHPGQLHYEAMRWADGASWRARVRAAAEELGLTSQLCGG